MIQEAKKHTIAHASQDARTGLGRLMASALFGPQRRTALSSVWYRVQGGMSPGPSLPCVGVWVFVRSFEAIAIEWGWRIGRGVGRSIAM